MDDSDACGSDSAIGSGATPRGGSKVYVDEGVALVRSQNVYDHEFRWDGRTSDGTAVASGMYVYRIVTEESSIARKMLLVR